jgi:hypothetical protein
VAVLTEVEPRKGLTLRPSTNRVSAPWCRPTTRGWLCRMGCNGAVGSGDHGVARSPSSITRRTFDSACEQARVSPRVLLELDSREAVTEAVAAAVGGGDCVVGGGQP